MKGVVVILSVVLAVHVVAGLRICHHNDFHSRYEPINSFDQECPAEQFAVCRGGLARTSQQMTDSMCDLKIHAGDFIQGTIFDLFVPEIAIEAYNLVGYDYATLGNHEFDKGSEGVATTVAGLTKTKMLSTNVDMTGAPKPVSFQKVEVVTVAGVKLCILAVTTTETTIIALPGPGVTFEDEATAIRNALPDCGDAIDNLIVISHIGVEADVALAEAVPEIDVIIGGHSHTNMTGYYPIKVKRADGSVAHIAQAGAYTQFLGVLDLSFAMGIVSLDDAQYLTLKDPAVSDKAVEDFIVPYRQQVNDLVKVVVGSIADNIDQTLCRSTECAMGNFVCEAVMAFAGPTQGAQICLQNGGGLRASLTKGNVTRENVLTVLPFGNYHVVFDISGADLIKNIEQGLSMIELGAGRFPQLGLKDVELVFNKTAPAGSRIVSFKLGGKHIKRGETYRVVTNNFVAAGGDGYTFPTDAFNVLNSGLVLADLVEEFLMANPNWKPYVTGHVRDVSAPTPRPAPKRCFSVVGKKQSGRKFRYICECGMNTSKVFHSCKNACIVAVARRACRKGMSMKMAILSNKKRCGC